MQLRPQIIVIIQLLCVELYVSPIFSYRNVKNKILRAVASEFHIPNDKLYLTKPTFFSRMTTKPAQTVHDEYWHVHVDKVCHVLVYRDSPVERTPP